MKIRLDMFYIVDFYNPVAPALFIKPFSTVPEADKFLKKAEKHRDISFKVISGVALKRKYKVNTLRLTNRLSQYMSKYDFPEDYTDYQKKLYRERVRRQGKRARLRTQGALEIISYQKQILLSRVFRDYLHDDRSYISANPKLLDRERLKKTLFYPYHVTWVWRIAMVMSIHYPLAISTRTGHKPGKATTNTRKYNLTSKALQLYKEFWPSIEKRIPKYLRNHPFKGFKYTEEEAYLEMQARGFIPTQDFKKRKPDRPYITSIDGLLIYPKPFNFTHQHMEDHPRTLYIYEALKLYGVPGYCRADIPHQCIYPT